MFWLPCRCLNQPEKTNISVLQTIKAMTVNCPWVTLNQGTAEKDLHLPGCVSDGILVWAEDSGIVIQSCQVQPVPKSNTHTHQCTNVLQIFSWSMVWFFMTSRKKMLHRNNTSKLKQPLSTHFFFTVLKKRGSSLTSLSFTFIIPLQCTIITLFNDYYDYYYFNLMALF